MNEIAEVQAELRQITQSLTEAAEKINNGITLDLSDLGPRAQQLCERILRLPPDQALTMLEEMTDAVEKLNMLSSKIKS